MGSFYETRAQDLDSEGCCGCFKTPVLGLKQLYFGFDQHMATATQLSSLGRNVEILKDIPDAVIKMLSHCDASGISAYNLMRQAQPEENRRSDFGVVGLKK
jgi:outer membrane protein OmpA-like peptidoglycan-associated protein